MNILLQESIGGPVWALVTAIGGSLLSALGIVWKMYLTSLKENRRVQEEKLQLVIQAAEKREEDNRKNVEMLLKVQNGFESLMKVSTRLDGMITQSEKQEIIQTYRKIQEDVHAVRDRILKENNS